MQFKVYHPKSIFERLIKIYTCTTGKNQIHWNHQKSTVLFFSKFQKSILNLWMTYQPSLSYLNSSISIKCQFRKSKMAPPSQNLRGICIWISNLCTCSHSSTFVYYNKVSCFQVCATEYITAWCCQNGLKINFLFIQSVS